MKSRWHAGARDPLSSRSFSSPTRPRRRGGNVTDRRMRPERAGCSGHWPQDARPRLIGRAEAPQQSIGGNPHPAMDSTCCALSGPQHPACAPRVTRRRRISSDHSPMRIFIYRHPFGRYAFCRGRARSILRTERRLNAMCITPPEGTAIRTVVRSAYPPGDSNEPKPSQSGISAPFGNPAALSRRQS